jgi:hypothetical protein
MSGLTKCAACRKEKPVSEMKTCMHNQMHRYVCDAKCMHDFYNPPKKPASDYDQLHAANQRLEGEVARLKTALSQAVEYLDVSNFEQINSRSLLHIRMKAALSTNGEVTE